MCFGESRDSSTSWDRLHLRGTRKRRYTFEMFGMLTLSSSRQDLRGKLHHISWKYETYPKKWYISTWYLSQKSNSHLKNRCLFWKVIPIQRFDSQSIVISIQRIDTCSRVISIPKSDTYSKNRYLFWSDTFSKHLYLFKESIYIFSSDTYSKIDTYSKNRYLFWNVIPILTSRARWVPCTQART